MDIHGYISWGMGGMGDLLPGGGYRVGVTTFPASRRLDKGRESVFWGTERPGEVRGRG